MRRPWQGDAVAGMAAVALAGVACMALAAELPVQWRRHAGCWAPTLRAHRMPSPAAAAAVPTAPQLGRLRGTAAVSDCCSTAGHRSRMAPAAADCVAVGMRVLGCVAVGLRGTCSSEPCALFAHNRCSARSQEAPRDRSSDLSATHFTVVGAACGSHTHVHGPPVDARKAYCKCELPRHSHPHGR